MKILVKRKIGRNWRLELAVKHLFVFTVENDVQRVTAFNPKHNHE